MLHYHGTPIAPASVLSTLAGRCFCVSFARPEQVVRCHEIGQSVVLDNGAFSIWRRAAEGKRLARRLVGPARGDWSGYFDWVEPWLEYPTTWAVIPDLIEGTVEDNDRLLVEWAQRGLPRGAPVWHMHEPIERLQRFAHSYEKVCVGSSGRFVNIGNDRWRRRMDEAMDALCDSGPVPVWLHMLRGMSLSGSEYPFASVDSTDIGRNHARARKRGRTAIQMALRWDALQNPARWGGSDEVVAPFAAPTPPFTSCPGEGQDSQRRPGESTPSPRRVRRGCGSQPKRRRNG